MYTEAKVDVTQEIEQRAQQAAQAGADHCALYFLCYIHFSLSVVLREHVSAMDGSRLSNRLPKWQICAHSIVGIVRYLFPLFNINGDWLG